MLRLSLNSDRAIDLVKKRARLIVGGKRGGIHEKPDPIPPTSATGALLFPNYVPPAPVMFGLAETTVIRGTTNGADEDFVSVRIRIQPDEGVMSLRFR